MQILIRSKIVKVLDDIFIQMCNGLDTFQIYILYIIYSFEHQNAKTHIFILMYSLGLGSKYSKIVECYHWLGVQNIR